jgi:hypothetical protein
LVPPRRHGYLFLFLVIRDLMMLRLQGICEGSEGIRREGRDIIIISFSLLQYFDFTLSSKKKKERTTKREGYKYENVFLRQAL